MKKTKYAYPVKAEVYKSGMEYYFAFNLRRLRLSADDKLTQAKLAKKLGVSRNTYAGYEAGTRFPPAWFVYCTADYFKVTVDELVGKQIQKERTKQE